MEGLQTRIEGVVEASRLRSCLTRGRSARGLSVDKD